MAKEKICKKILKYTVVFEPADEGGFVAFVPALPGCVTQGETYEETVKMIKDAISGYLAVATSFASQQLSLRGVYDEAIFLRN